MVYLYIEERLRPDGKDEACAGKNFAAGWK